MPFVDLHSSDDFASIYYMTNSPFGNVGGFDPEKPTVLILHGLFLDTQWLDYHWGDPRLYQNFNLIAFDMRCAGRSVCRPSPRHDTWVEAADIALCHQKLRLPPCHILALEPSAVCCALRFAVLFPELCLSLALCNVPSPTEPEWAFGVLDETMRRWCFANDLETFEHGGVEAVNLLCGCDNDIEVYDNLIAYLALKTPIRQRIQVAEPFGVYVNRTPLREEELAEIFQPVLIFHGERNDLHSYEHAERLKDSLTGVDGGAILYTIMSGASNLSLNRLAASTLNKVYSRFLLERIERAKSQLRMNDISIQERMQRALFKLADITDQPEVASRDPLASISFSCLPEQAIQRQAEMLKEYNQDLGTKFSPLGPDGKPIRKYSDRRGRHWFEGGTDGLSVADAPFIPLRSRGRSETDSIVQGDSFAVSELPLSIPTSAVTSNQLFKTSLAKIVANPTNTLGRAIVSV